MARNVIRAGDVWYFKEGDKTVNGTPWRQVSHADVIKLLMKTEPKADPKTGKIINNLSDAEQNVRNDILTELGQLGHGGGEMPGDEEKKAAAAQPKEKKKYNWAEYKRNQRARAKAKAEAEKKGI